MLFKTLRRFGIRRVSTLVQNNNKITVSVEGNVGSGKTTLLQYFSKTPNIQVCPEPVEKWMNINGENGLEYLYKDPERWGMPVQTFIQLTMVQSHLIPHTQPLKMMERSIYSAKYCFAENLHQKGFMADVEYNVLTEWFDWIKRNNDVHLDLIVYLQTKPEVVLERVKKRQRNAEKTISLAQLEAFHDLHEAWLIKGTSFPCCAPVLILDGNTALEDMKEQYEANRKNIVGNFTSHSDPAG